MTGNLHVVLTCTKRKRHSAALALQLRNHVEPEVDTRFESWLATLQEAVADTPVPVKDLYAGDHWQRGCGLPAIAAQHGGAVRLWVCSAGYGLIPVESRVLPYSATFSRGHPDAVWRPEDGRSHPAAVREWWRLLATWRGPDPEAPRSISALTAQADGAPIWVVASPTYLAAMQPDLLAAARISGTPDRLVLISAGAKRLEGLDDHLLPFDWRLQGSAGPLGGAAMSLNVRVAELLLQEDWEQGTAGMRARLAKLLEELPRREPPSRKRVSESEVEEYIRTELRRNPNARPSPLLRKLRDELSWAFEEKRFRRIVAAVRSSSLE